MIKYFRVPYCGGTQQAHAIKLATVDEHLGEACVIGQRREQAAASDEVGWRMRQRLGKDHRNMFKLRAVANVPVDFGEPWHLFGWHIEGRTSSAYPAGNATADESRP